MRRFFIVFPSFPFIREAVKWFHVACNTSRRVVKETHKWFSLIFYFIILMMLQRLLMTRRRFEGFGKKVVLTLTSWHFSIKKDFLLNFLPFIINFSLHFSLNARKGCLKVFWLIILTESRCKSFYFHERWQIAGSLTLFPQEKSWKLLVKRSFSIKFLYGISIALLIKPGR